MWDRSDQEPIVPLACIVKEWADVKDSASNATTCSSSTRHVRRGLEAGPNFGYVYTARPGRNVTGKADVGFR